MTSTTTSLSTSRLVRLRAPRPLASRWRNAARLGFGGFYLAMATYDATMILPNAAASYKQIADELAWPGFDWLLLARDYDRSLGTWFAARKTRRQPR